eukprot:GFYU01015945.1.p1 GENE.GFYU01015945.1~~GFYU01015945.1.p1  ORF type:complete len:119 (+),score=8.55 GFYU01015945.1:11-367(+)
MSSEDLWMVVSPTSAILPLTCLPTLDDVALALLRFRSTTFSLCSLWWVFRLYRCTGRLVVVLNLWNVIIIDCRWVPFKCILLTFIVSLKVEVSHSFEIKQQLQERWELCRCEQVVNAC